VRFASRTPGVSSIELDIWIPGVREANRTGQRPVSEKCMMVPLPAVFMRVPAYPPVTFPQVWWPQPLTYGFTEPGPLMHRKLDILNEKGFVVLRGYDGPTIPPGEWEGLEYMDWKSGGDTTFAPLASATGEMDCKGFWDFGKPDKGGVWTKNRELAPALVRYIESIGGLFGRVRVIKLNPSDEESALRQMHRDDNNRLNPVGSGWVVRSWLELANNPGASAFILREDRGDPATESRVTLHPGRQMVIDTERLYHVVHHPGPGPRYALITSWESDDIFDRWVRRELPALTGLPDLRRAAVELDGRGVPPDLLGRARLPTAGARVERGEPLPFGASTEGRARRDPTPRRR